LSPGEVQLLDEIVRPTRPAGESRLGVEVEREEAVFSA